MRVKAKRRLGGKRWLEDGRVSERQEAGMEMTPLGSGSQGDTGAAQAAETEGPSAGHRAGTQPIPDGGKVIELGLGARTERSHQIPTSKTRRRGLDPTVSNRSSKSTDWIGQSPSLLPR